MMDKKLLEILACPICKGRLEFEKSKQLLICKYDRLAYPIRNGIPILLEEEANEYDPDQA
jgi:uncharacterized protein YbaR (Trm112 family)